MSPACNWWRDTTFALSVVDQGKKDPFGSSVIVNQGKGDSFSLKAQELLGRVV